MKKPERAELLQTLARRFENSMARHEGISWDEVDQHAVSNHPSVLSD